MTNTIAEIEWKGIPPNGEITVAHEECELAFYEITVGNNYGFGGTKYPHFDGDEEIMKLEVENHFTNSSPPEPSKDDEEDYGLDLESSKKRYTLENSESVQEETAKIKGYGGAKKTLLHRKIDELKRALVPVDAKATIKNNSTMKSEWLCSLMS